MQRLRDADRGLAIGFIAFFLVIIIAALMFTLMDPAAGKIFGMASSQADSQQAKDVINQRERIWSNILYALLLLAVVMLIARAVFESDART